MTGFSRREFGQLALASLPFAFVLSRRIDPVFDGVRLGAITFSFSDMPNVVGQDHVDAIIADCRTSGVGLIELMSNHAEPVTEYQAQIAAARAARLAAAAAAAASGTPPPARGPAASGAARGRGPSPEAQKARDDLRQWRLATPMSHFADIKKKFNDARINVFAYCVNGMGDDFTSDEIDVMFEQAKTLGASTISSSTTLSTAQKLAPFCEKHQMTIAFHNEAGNLTDPNQFATPESYERGFALSKWFRANLDIGQFTQADFDAVAFIEKHHDNITHLHVKDDKKDGGPIMPFGEGDSPIKVVLQLLKKNKWPIVAEVEMEYPIPIGSNCAQEVGKCIAYLKNALA
jgi:sugar phosphate isomerase/epimerase